MFIIFISEFLDNILSVFLITLIKEKNGDGLFSDVTDSR